EGFALNKSEIPFSVGNGSYEGDAEGQIPYTPVEGENNKDAQQVKNTKVDIPQTGGMGTILFTVVGLALMTVAFIALRKKNSEQ
ncbi:MAG: LPXTG cell wall anchor domain-containing protein, partial [Andreesenia angusta]|nr:LPXTG cell wall anchor domain-containing protein [Andreesenia angusta]